MGRGGVGARLAPWMSALVSRGRGRPTEGRSGQVRRCLTPWSADQKSRWRALPGRWDPDLERIGATTPSGRSDGQSIPWVPRTAVTVNQHLGRLEAEFGIDAVTRLLGQDQILV